VQSVVQRRVLKPNGSTFTAEYADAPREFLASTDQWFHCVFTATGPDGAFYIVDFYRDIVEHPHWVAPEIRDKVDWRKGEEHGRIWRIRAKDAKPSKVDKLSRASNSALVHALESDNGWTRDTAQRLLVERAASDAVPDLERMALSGSRPQNRTIALYLLDQLKEKNLPILFSALRDHDPQVRRHAIRLLEPQALVSKEGAPADSILTRLAEMTGDPSGPVRLQLICSLGAFPNSPARRDALTRLARNADLDAWQVAAMLRSIGQETASMLQELKPLLDTGNDAQLNLLGCLVKSTVITNRGKERDAILDWLQHSESANRFQLMTALWETLPQPEQGDVAVQFASAGVQDAALNAKLPQRVRVAAIRLLAGVTQVRPAAEGALNALKLLLSRDEGEGIQVAAVIGLIDAADTEALRAAFTQWPVLARAARRQMIVSSVKSVGSGLALLDAVQSGKIARAEIDPLTRQGLQKHRDVTVMARAKLMFTEAVSPDREAVVAKYRASLTLDGDRARGAAQFERSCVVCHQMQGVGAKVGPDLSGIGTHSRETLLVDILDPSRQVLPDFAAYNAETKDGDSYTGFIANESTTTVTLRRANEADVTLRRAELKDFNTSGKSLMPDGLEAGMTIQDMADLLEFLRRPDRTLFTKAK
jgi:putative heme-binding domain-containing protein